MARNHELLPTPCDRAWAAVARQLTAEYGIPVKYDFWLSATIGGRPTGPLDWRRMRNVLDDARRRRGKSGGAR